MLKSNNPTGPFRKITDNIGHAIDFSVFIDDDGQWYAYWADDKGILGCKMASPTEFGEPQYIGADLHGWTEGPFVVKQEGKYHLTYTGNHFLSKGYRIHAAVADSPLGPYRDDPFNPVIIQTEGDVVGLGHSSTVLGPDLHTHYIVYHNLNPDKTRDLNIDPVVFTKEKAYVLGPTTMPRPAPTLPQWQLQRSTLQTVEHEFTEETILPSGGTVEVNLAAGAKTERYGIRFGKTTRIEFDKSQNMLSVIGSEGLIASRKLLENYEHEVLHCVRVEYGSSFAVYLDNLLQLEGPYSIKSGGICYYGDGELRIGTATIHSGETDLLYPVPCVAPGGKRIRFDISQSGEFQIMAMECSGMACNIYVDGVQIPPEQRDDTNKLTIYRCTLSAGEHTLYSVNTGAKTLAIVPFFAGCSQPFRVYRIGPFDKVCGMREFSNTRIRADFQLADCGENWQAGVLFRGSQFADGGEGNDKELGTNFFIGYRVCVSDGKIQLWKHRYDETLLLESNIKSADSYTFEIVAEGNFLSVISEGKQILSCRDAVPILCGRIGFHVRNCILTEGEIYDTTSKK